MPAKSWGELTEKERRVEIAENTPRKLLFERMHHAVLRELIPEGDDRCVEEIFEGMDQHTALLAIADLACALIVPTTDASGDYVDRGGPIDWVELIEVVTDQMHRWAADEEEEPLPPAAGRPQ